MRALLVEDVIAKDHYELEINFGVSRTQHSTERQSRHEEGYISNEEIISNIKGVLDNIVDDLIFNRLDVGTRVLIKNTETNLNIVGVPKSAPDNVIMFKLITVMREANFRNIKDTKTYRISNNDLK